MKIPLSWRRIKYRYRLIGTKCENCGKIYFPPRFLCPNCRRKGKLKEVKLSGKGKVFSFTIVHVPAKEHKNNSPYALAIVELEEGPRVIAQLVDCDFDEIYVGMPVEVVFRRITEEDGLIHYGYKFRPIRSGSHDG